MRTGALAGMEVPITGTDQLNWIQVAVPSEAVNSSYLLPMEASAADEDSDSLSYAPATQDSSSCHVIGDPKSYLVWRIHKSSPNVLEVTEFTGCDGVPKTGLRLVFQDALSPFAYICKDEILSTSGKTYLLYALTVSGVAYLLKLRNVWDYASGSVFPLNDLIEFSLQAYSQSAPISSVTATGGCLVVGRHDGSVSCFRLGVLDKSVQGFMFELRDDVGLGRLWGFMGRGRSVGPVQDMVISEAHGRKLVFVIHVDDSLRIWDLYSQTRLFNHTISSETSAGIISRLWVGDFNKDTCSISVAVLYASMEDAKEMIAIFSIYFNLGEKVSLLDGTSLQNIPFEEGGFIDLKLTSNKLWILKQDGLVMYNFLRDNWNFKEASFYDLHEDFIADQLFQGSEHSIHDLSWTSLSVSSVKDQLVPFVSSVFLRRLLHPGIYQTIALRATAHDYNKHWTDTEFKSLTIDGLKKEIFSLIEGEGVAPASIIYCWKNFCTRYFQHWCKNNAAYGLFVDDSTGAFGLIRKNSISLFRSLERIELLMDGSFDDIGDSINSDYDFPNDVLDREVIFEVLRCISCITQQLGKAPSAMFYESLVSPQMISSEEIIPGFVKILETGYSSLVAKLHVSQFGAEVAWKKELEDHKSHRKFSIDMILSFHALLSKAGSWDRVLNVIERYLKFLVPLRCSQRLGVDAVFNINSSVSILSTSQVANVMFESSFDVLLLLSYLVNVGGQIHVMHDDISMIQIELIPFIQEIITDWVIIHFLSTTPSESPALEDFSTRLSSLHIDSNTIRRSWNERLGTCDFTLACLLFLSSRNSSEDMACFSSRSFPSPDSIVCSVQNFSSWIIHGGTGEESSSSFNRSIELGTILLHQGQYEAIENLFGVVYAHSCNEKTAGSIQTDSGEWCAYFHLLGFCLLVRAQCESNGIQKERKVREAVRCFFRASSGHGASKALMNLSSQGFPHPSFTPCSSEATWKFYYYQWAMQIFEQYNMSEGACQFALAALEQVDEIFGSKDDKYGEGLLNDSAAVEGLLNDSATTVRGRLWANVFKFTLDLNNYYDAYCAIISNPDEDNKNICLRRFIIVLCERGAYKTLCAGQLPFIGLTEKMEQELSWKAERSDVAAKMNPYKLLYAFETHRHNWRRAASYMYRYSSRLRSEVLLKEHQPRSVTLQERLNGLSTTINALSLVHPAYAWVVPQSDDHYCENELYPNKKSRIAEEETSMLTTGVQSWRQQYCVDVEKLEKEYVQTSAEYLLSLANVKLKIKENQIDQSDLVDLLVQSNLYDMAFTVLLKFWKGSELKREMERVFIAVAQKCCPNSAETSYLGNDYRSNGLQITLSGEDDFCGNGITEPSPIHHSIGSNTPWEILEQYLEKYKKVHPRLPIIVAETLLRADRQIELPLWLVQMFKGGRRATSWGMTGLEPDPASLFRLYVDYGRFTEATNLLLEYIESFASLRPADIVNRKKMSATWFPYTAIERLWCQLEDTRNSGHMIDQCEQLIRILQGALSSHLNLISVDSHDVISAAAC